MAKIPGILRKGKINPLNRRKIKDRRKKPFNAVDAGKKTYIGMISGPESVAARIPTELRDTVNPNEINEKRRQTIRKEGPARKFQGKHVGFKPAGKIEQFSTITGNILKGHTYTVKTGRRKSDRKAIKKEGFGIIKKRKKRIKKKKK
jgi:hypothetical protein